MHTRHKRSSTLLVLLGMVFMLAILPTFSTAARQVDDPLPAPSTPEPYPNSDIYPATLLLESEDDLQVLYRLGIDIGNLQPVVGAFRNPPNSYKPSIATVYIIPTQSTALSQAGLVPVPIPNEGYRSYLAHGPGSGSPDAWPTFTEYVARMQDLENAHPGIVDLQQIGTSVQGRGLYCMQITDNPGVNEAEPEFKYTANHHGDETTGVEMTMRLAELLATSYGVDPVLTDMVDKMEIWLCPIYNPDGYIAGTRYNAHGVDLNRDFPDRFTDPIDDPVGHEPETQAFMILGFNHRFVMGANYHGGAQVLNYPWDAVAAPGDPVVPAYAPDDTLFYDLGYGYTSRNPDLLNGGWPNGLVRGWQWYQVWGGMQDWAYYYRGEHHVTLEISNTKNPPFSTMDYYWNHNRDAMLWWMTQAMTGVGGLVLDARDSTPLHAVVSLVGRGEPNTIRTDPDAGDYHRVIGAGSYELNVTADCYESQSATVNVVSGQATVQDFHLDPLIDLSPSIKTASTGQAYPGDEVSYQIRLENTCLTANVTVTDTLPTQMTWTGYLTATHGTPIFDAGQILWQGEVSQSLPITITYSSVVNPCLVQGITLLNNAVLDEGVTGIITRTAQVAVANAAPFLPNSPIPGDGAVNQPITTILSWAPASDLNCDAITYDIAFGDIPTPPITAIGLAEPNYAPGTLLAGSTYYWYVIARDGLTYSQGPTWHFTTASTIQRVFLPFTLR